MKDVFHENLRTARKIRGLTQQEVADALGVAKSTYNMYESGKREPDVLKIKKLAKILGVTGDFLLGMEPIGQLEKDFEMMKRKFGEDKIRAFIEALEKVTQ